MFPERTCCFNAGAAAVDGLHGTSPAEAVSAWQAIEPVAQGLGLCEAPIDSITKAGKLGSS